MSRRRPQQLRASRAGQAGFSLVELLVVISLISIIVLSFASFFTNYLILYSKFQKDSTSFTDLAHQSERIADVLRGVTDLVSVGANDLTGYAYFSPVDTYTSLVRYYVNPTGTAILVDVTPMTANPPNGTLISARKKTYTIVSNFYQAPGGSLFGYYDAGGTLLTQPISDEHTILEIQVNLATTASHSANGQTLSITTSLRNRKTNL